MRLIMYLIYSARLRYTQEIIERIEADRMTYTDDYREALRERTTLVRKLRAF